MVDLTVTGPKGLGRRKLVIVGGVDRLALTPPLGWNSWNVWGTSVSAERIRQAADAFEQSGLADHGFVYVNMDSNKVPEVSWDEQFEGTDQQERFKQFDFDDFDFDHSYTMDGNFNWKILADNFNECYHCKTTHPDLPAIANLETYDVQCSADHIDHDPKSNPDQVQQGLNICSTYLFPYSSYTVR